MKLELLGWNSFFERFSHDLEQEQLIPARVIKASREHFLVHSLKGELTAELAGRMRHHASSRAELPAVGDWVGLRPPDGDGPGMLHRCLPRRSCFSRKLAGEVTDEQVVAANVDTIFLVAGLDLDFNLRRLERYLTLAWESGAAPVILLNKSDQCASVGRLVSEVEDIAPGVPIHALSALKSRGLEALTPYLKPGATVAFLGSSGVGKSSLVNCLLGEERLRTRSVREHDSHGRHTTTTRELMFLESGALVLDTPGMRELQLWGDEDSLDQSFPEIEMLASQCRFRDCTHQREPGCAVQEALEAGELEEARFQSYLKLRGELKALTVRRNENPRQQERAVGRMRASYLKEIERFRHGGRG